MTDDKKTLFNKLESINEDAHNYAYNLWEEAGRLEDEHGYTDEVEEKKILSLNSPNIFTLLTKLVSQYNVNYAISERNCKSS